MINGIKIKICGITSAGDAAMAVTMGADFLGFNIYPKSPRYAPLAQYQVMRESLPSCKRVAVCSKPSATDLADLLGQGFDYYQMNFDVDTLMPLVFRWAEIIGPQRLWLAPRLPAGMEVDPEWLPLADTFLLDTFHADKSGGTGQTGDWAKFKRHHEGYPGKQWILTGGLNPENIGRAVTASGAKFVDVNNGVEQAPGIKSPAKLKAFAHTLQRATRCQTQAA